MGMKYKFAIFYLNGQFTFQNVEELMRMMMRMPCFTRTGRHELFDNTQMRCIDEAPAVAIGSARSSPFVMFCRLDADDLCNHFVLREI